MCPDRHIIWPNIQAIITASALPVGARLWIPSNKTFVVRARRSDVFPFSAESLAESEAPDSAADGHSVLMV
jgi:adenylyl- and sulfurtransferase ThiI